MCVRTKFTYGCGHEYRNTEDCRSIDCAGLDRYLIEKEGDCKTCKRDDPRGDRGRDGHGRYAQEMRRLRERSRSTAHESGSVVSSSGSVIRRSTIEASSNDGMISPWATSLMRERPWESPHRKQADDMWLTEHESRLSDLQHLLEDVHVSPQQRRPLTPTRRSKFDPEDQYRDEQESEETMESAHQDYMDDDDNDDDLIDDLPTPSRYVVEIRKKADNASSHHSRSQSGRSYHTEVRQYSHDSLPDSMPSYRSSPRHKSQSTSMRYGQPEQNYEYDYYTSRQTAPRSHARRSIGGAKTEPYTHSQSTGGYEYDYEHAHPVVVDSMYANTSPRYYLPQRSSGYRYKPHEQNQISSTYAKYQPR